MQKNKRRIRENYVTSVLGGRVLSSRPGGFHRLIKTVITPFGVVFWFGVKVAGKYVLRGYPCHADNNAAIISMLAITDDWKSQVFDYLKKILIEKNCVSFKTVRF